ncbi:MAG: 1,4-dihydroxy-2-naphthoate polyprenyltransferase [Bacillota bacterium]
MRLNSFLSLVEIRTKIASMIPFSLGTVYALYRFNRFEVRNFILFFISLLAFDMVTTALNNYYDYKRAKKKHGYNYEKHNAIVRYDLKESTVIAVIAILLSIAVISGLLLFLNTSVILLLIGAASFAIGIAYSFGPVPISRMPLGEVFSGFFMGFVIVFLSVFIHVYDLNIVSIMLEGQVMSLSVNVVEVIYIFLFSVPAVLGIANIMLANNICDMDDDIENKRYTLPIYIGKDKALLIFRVLYYIAYVDLVVLSILKVIPFLALLSILTLITVNKNIKLFNEKQTKKDTFILSVRNFVFISGSLLLLLGVSSIPLLFGSLVTGKL